MELNARRRSRGYRRARSDIAAPALFAPVYRALAQQEQRVPIYMKLHGLQRFGGRSMFTIATYALRIGLKLRAPVGIGSGAPENIYIVVKIELEWFEFYLQENIWRDDERAILRGASVGIGRSK